MNMHRNGLRKSTVLVLLLLVVACAGTSLKKISEMDQQDLPHDLKDKFEVRDMLHSPTPSASARAVTESIQLPQPVVQNDSSKKGKAKKVKQPKVVKKAEQTAVVVPTEETSKSFVIPNRRPKNDPIWVGEKHVFGVSYFGVTAGDFSVEVMPFKKINNRKVYHIKGMAVSSKVFSLFYRLNDTVESFIDFEGFFSHQLHVVLDETKQQRDSLELNDIEKAQTFYWNRWQRVDRPFSEIKKYESIQPLSQDTLSALYYLRTLPLKDGDVVQIPVVSEARNWNAIATVVRREELNTVVGKVKAIVINPETQHQGIMKNQGKNWLWISDDDRRIILKLEAKVRIGSVVAELKHFDSGTQ